MNKPFGDFGRTDPADAGAFAATPSLEKRRLRAYLVMLVTDLVLMHAGFALAGLAYHQVWFEWRAMMQAQLLLPIFWTIALYNAAYSAPVLTDWRFAMRKLAAALLIATVLLNFVAFYTKSNANFSRATFTLGLGFSFALMIAARVALSRIVARLWGGRVQNELVIDDGGPKFALPGAARIDASAAGIAPLRDDPHMLDRLGQVLRNQDKVVVSCPDERRADWAYVLKGAGLRGEILSRGAEALGALGVVRYEAQGRASLVVSAGPLGLRQRVAKRAFDLALAGAGLILLSPLLILIALAIRLYDGGPVLFRQVRVGRGNRFFTVLKFRTMHFEESDPAGVRSTAAGDPRVTPLGRILRATSLDELPQLWNVLKSDMSIVGPRPHALGSRANAKPFWEVDTRYWARHSLKPGMTGLAQVRGLRGSTQEESHLTDRVQADLEYIAGWSLLADAAIVMRTLGVLWHARAF